jgi:hypothetical protein
MPEQVVILTKKVYEEIQRELSTLGYGMGAGRVAERVKRALFASPHVQGWDWNKIPGLNICVSKHAENIYWIGDGPCPECQRRK